MRVRALILGLAVALLWALPAFTQGNPNGKLSGRVTTPFLLRLRNTLSLAMMRQ